MNKKYTCSLDHQIIIHIQPVYKSKPLPSLDSNLDIDTLQYLHLGQRLIHIVINTY